MASRFSLLLRRRLLAQGIGIREFARRSGLSAGHVSRISSGHEPPPLPELASWAILLDLQGQQRASFMREGMLAHTPAPIASEYRRFRRLIERLAPHELAESEGRSESIDPEV
jgi:transcriptional regulator with XRE-family HTH domain